MKSMEPSDDGAAVTTARDNVAKYLDHPNFCPLCLAGADQLDYDVLDDTANCQYVARRVHCARCEGTWHDVYKLNSIEIEVRYGDGKTGTIVIEALPKKGAK